MTAMTSDTCLDPQRRSDVRSRGSNGLDYAEVSAEQSALTVYFLRKAPATLQRANVVIDAGAAGLKVRVIDIRLCSVDDPEQDDCMLVLLDRRGSMGMYTIRLVEVDAEGNATDTPLAGFDPRYARLAFRFDTAATTEIDPARKQPCAGLPQAEPDVNYLAKDYNSFLQLIYDRLALTLPAWQEQHAPDEMVALVEILAYVADYLSYYQDAVATEAYLKTARQRISVRRHVRLLGYRMHEGCNARAWVVVNTSQDVIGLDARSIYFVATYDAVFAPGEVLLDQDISAAAGNSALLFAPIINAPLNLYAAHNDIRIYTWGDRLCCLPKGTISATLLDSWQEGEPQTRGLHLRVGDVLLLKEIVGSATGSADDADITHQQFVQLTKITQALDSLYTPPVPVVEVEWAAEDALTFPLCLSTIGPAAQGCRLLGDVSVARGNAILLDQGSWLRNEIVGTVPLSTTQHHCTRVDHPAKLKIAAGVFRPMLTYAPIVCRQAGAHWQGAADALLQDPRLAQPQILLRSILPLPDGSGPLFSVAEFAEPQLLAARIANLQDEPSRLLEQCLSSATRAQLKSFHPQQPEALQALLAQQFVRVWTAQPDLLESRAEDCHYIVENDDMGVAHLRFGDGELGRAVEAGETFFADYRIGAGVAGNLGAQTILNLVCAGEQRVEGSLAPCNPMAAKGAMAPESADEVKLFAPGTALTTMQRAITADDYATLAERNPRVQRAAARLDWTGTCYEVRVAIDPLGAETVEPDLLREVESFLYPFRRIGHALVVSAARYVPLGIAMSISVLAEFLADHVRAALLDAFSNRILAGGALGFFHPDRLSFGDNIYLSQLIETALSVEGVVSVTVMGLERLYAGPDKELESGFLAIGPLEVAQLDNDPDRPENGKLVLTLEGGL